MYQVVLLFSTVIGNVWSLREFLWENRTTHWEKARSTNQGPFYAQPEQIHLAYDGQPDRISVTWLTFDDTKMSCVQYGLSPDVISHGKLVTSNMSRFVDGGRKKSVRYIHRAWIEKLKAGERYYYRVGSTYGWSTVYTFTALKQRPDGGYRYALFGDMGNKNARSLGKIQSYAQLGLIDVIIHNGDFAYNMHNSEGQYGDQFMRQIEPAAAIVPYMTSVGNHEQAYNCSHYVNRFTMPHTDHSLFYSFDLDQAHFIAISTEFYYYAKVYGNKSVETQFNWLVNDLTTATQNRHNVPWIIVFGHRSMYCTDVQAVYCKRDKEFIRDGVDENGTYGLEKLLYDYGVDIYFGAHEHNYERFWPLYQFEVRNGTKSPYTDPPATVHLVSGSAGCQEGINTFPPNPAHYSAFRSGDYGFGVFQVFNSTHLFYEQVAAYTEKSQDSFWIIKHSHKPFRDDSKFSPSNNDSKQ